MRLRHTSPVPVQMWQPRTTRAVAPQCYTGYVQAGLAAAAERTVAAEAAVAAVREQLHAERAQAQKQARAVHRHHAHAYMHARALTDALTDARIACVRVAAHAMRDSNSRRKGTP